MKLAETICAFANTVGGIILIGVQSDKRRGNIPVSIPGIEIRDDLEERIINICLGHIQPVVSPEVKLCTFIPDDRSDGRAVLYIRVDLSYAAPHYLLGSNKIPVRVHNRNEGADLRTIENLIAS